MSCRRFRPLLAEAALDALRPEAAHDLAAHLERCEECAAELAGIRAALALVDRSRPQPAPRTDVWARLEPALDAIEAERQRVPWWRVLTAHPARLALAAAALLLAGGLGLLVALHHPSAPANIAPAGAETGASVEERLEGYLQRSTPLLVALANRDAGAAAEAFDGAAERRLARALARDGHALAGDLRQARRSRDTALVGDLVVLFMQIGNTPGERYRSTVALARETIARQELLFALSVQELRRAGEPPARGAAPA